MKYKVGDKVKVREDLVVDKKYSGVYFVNGMKACCGRIAVINGVVNGLGYNIDIDVGGHTWNDDMFVGTINDKKLYDTRVIFNPPATILFMDGKKYVSKVHEEEFDEEKGLLMCLAKAQGITHLKLKRLIKNAKRGK